MVRMKKLPSLIAILLTISMLFAACGGSVSPSETSSGSEASSAKQEESTEAPQESSEPSEESAVSEESSEPSDESAASEESSEPSEDSAASEESEPSEADGTVQTVEITMDNWQDYLEIVPMENMAAALMGGAISDPATTNFYEYDLVLKEEYVNGYLEHANYTLPDLEGQSLGTPVIRSMLDSGTITIDTYPDIHFTYTVDYPHAISRQNPTIESGAENIRVLNDLTFARYLLASSNCLGEYNDAFKVCGMPLIGIVTGKDEDLSSLAESGNGIDVLTNNVTVEIRSISGTLQIWPEE